MNSQQIVDYCLTMQGARIDFPFNDGTLCLKVVDKLFALVFELQGKPKVTLKCVADVGIFLREKYPDIVGRAHHFPMASQPYHYTVDLTKPIDDKEMMAMIEHSYQSVVDKMSKVKRAQNGLVGSKDILEV